MPVHQLPDKVRQDPLSKHYCRKTGLEYTNQIKRIVLFHNKFTLVKKIISRDKDSMIYDLYSYSKSRIWLKESLRLN